MSASSFVYVIGGDGPTKVGVSDQPHSRVSYLRHKHGRSLEIFALFPFDARLLAFDVEGAAHEVLADHCVRREWFDVTPEAAAEAVYTVSGRLAEFILRREQERLDEERKRAKGAELLKRQEARGLASGVGLTGIQFMIARRSLGWLKQASFARDAGVSQSIVSRAERVGRRYPKLSCDAIAAMMAALSKRGATYEKVGESLAGGLIVHIPRFGWVLP